LPRSFLEALGVRSVGGRRFKPANSQVIERGVWAL